VHAEYCTPDYGVVFGPSTDVLDRLTFSFIAAIIIQRSDHYIYIFFLFYACFFCPINFLRCFWTDFLEAPLHTVSQKRIPNIIDCNL